MPRIFSLIFFIIVIPFFSFSQSGLDLKSLDNYIENARKQWDVPGLAVTVVYEGNTILSKGYGVRSVQTMEKVDTETLFMLGSTTKAMTAASMAMLVDEGLVNWNDKVIDHLPWFQLDDPYMTRELEIRDLFTHNSGLGNADLLWVLWDYSTEEIVQRLRKLPPSYSMRSSYTYQNIMYAVAGLIIEKLSGMDWSEFIHKRLFQPLGMNRSCALKSCAEQYQNRSRPHYPVDSGIIEIIDSNADSIGAAGSAWSCSQDIARWMQFVLDSTVVGGNRLISKRNFRILHKPHIIIPDGQFYPTVRLTHPDFTAYSLGWFMHDYHGELVQFHTGSLNGSGAIIGLMPEKNLGVYVMINLDHAEVRHAIMYKVFDHISNFAERDWSTEFHKLYSDRSKELARARKERMTVKGEYLPRTIDNALIPGTYSNDYLGQVIIEIQDNQPRITCRADRHLKLNHWNHNTFVGKIEEYAHDQGTLIDFDLGANGNVTMNFMGYEFIKMDVKKGP